MVAGDVNDPYVISVNSSNPGYANDFSGSSNASYIGTTVTGTYNGTIDSYRFVNVTGGATSRALNTTAVGGTRVAQITSTDTADNAGFDSFGQNVQGYTTTDPGAFLTDGGVLTSLEGNTPTRNFNAGIRDLDDFTGVVDISGMTQGSIYLFSGSYNTGGFSITANMTGASLTQVDSAELFTGTPVAQQNIYATRIDFVNDLGYDTLTYTSSGSRYVGTVLTAVPEPSAFALLGLGGLALCLRRRK